MKDKDKPTSDKKQVTKAVEKNILQVLVPIH